LTKSVQQLCFEIKGSSAIVTGASSGLGTTFAEALAESGVNLVLSARRMERLEKLSGELAGRYGVKAVPFRCDVTEEEDVKAMVKKAVEENGSLEIIVNNAGTSAIAPSTDLPLDEWRKVIDVNLTGVFMCARTAAREMMKKRYGKVINIASIYGAVGDIFTASPYYASKGGVVNLTRALAVEWAPHGINVNAIAPGFFPSEMTEAIFEDEETLNYIKNRTPLKRVGDPIDLKAALIYLASPGSNYVTGQTIFVDGGWTAL
jgi:NAD(P)-dependent dehydrogenase (short-subunit alcohol dehydrogenase family)